MFTLPERSYSIVPLVNQDAEKLCDIHSVLFFWGTADQFQRLGIGMAHFQSVQTWHKKSSSVKLFFVRPITARNTGPQPLSFLLHVACATHSSEAVCSIPAGCHWLLIYASASPEKLSVFPSVSHSMLLPCFPNLAPFPHSSARDKRSPISPSYRPTICSGHITIDRRAIVYLLLLTQNKWKAFSPETPVYRSQNTTSVFQLYICCETQARKIIINFIPAYQMGS